MSGTRCARAGAAGDGAGGGAADAAAQASRDASRGRTRRSGAGKGMQNVQVINCQDDNPSRGPVWNTQANAGLAAEQPTAYAASSGIFARFADRPDAVAEYADSDILVGRITTGVTHGHSSAKRLQIDATTSCHCKEPRTRENAC